MIRPKNHIQIDKFYEEPSPDRIRNMALKHPSDKYIDQYMPNCYNFIKTLSEECTMKKILKFSRLSFVLSLLTVFILTGCGNQGGSKPDPSEPINLVGTWEEKNKGETFHQATISGDVIEIYWIMDNGETKSLYWSGSYVAPPDGHTGEYSWDSANDKSKTDYALLASGDDTKTFTYKDGEITYEASAMGTTTTVHLIQTSTE